MSGYTVLGGATDRVITIRLKNALDLAKGQSSLATVASWVPGAGPEFVEGQTYEAVAQKIGESLAEQRADVDVRVIDGTSISPQPKTYYLAPKPRPRLPQAPGGAVQEGGAYGFAKTYKWGIVAGISLSGIAALAWHYLANKNEG